MRIDQLGEWRVSPYLRDIKLFEQRHGIDRYLAQILSNRGVQSPEQMHRWLHVEYSYLRDPLRMIDCAKSVERIWRAIIERESITIYGDYDADGICSAALLFLALKKLASIPILVYLPNRFREPRGLHRESIDHIHRQGTTLIVTTDCGSSDGDALLYASSLGIDIIVTDHHEVPPLIPEAAYTLVNPYRQDADDGDRGLCGSGVAFKLVQALYRRSGLLSDSDEQELLGLVALGTIADVVPLVGDNHILVHLGLLYLQKTQNVGLQALLQIASIKQDEPVRERAVAFYVAPRVNAAARMEDPQSAFVLLTTTQQDEAESLAGKLERLNRQRQSETDHMYQLALIQAEAQRYLPILFVGGNGWHKGIIGLVAGKLLEQYERPVVVVSQDPHTGICHGSVRSTVNFHIVEALREFSHPFEHVGGHARAAGFSLQEMFLKELHQHLLNTWKQLFPLWPHVRPVGSEKIIDMELAKANILTPAFYMLVQSAGPYGSGFKEPVFLLRKLRLLHVTTSRFGTHYLHLCSPDKQWHGTGKASAHLIEGLSEEEQVWVSIVFIMDAPKENLEGPVLRVLHLERYREL